MLMQKFLNRVARYLRSYGFLAVATGSTVITDASDEDLAEAFVACRVEV